MGILAELDIAGPVPLVFNAPALPDQADADSLVLLALLLGNVLRMSTSTTSTPRT